jgi:hypothetical protein
MYGKSTRMHNTNIQYMHTVLTVDAYVAMDPKRRQALMDFMEENMPAKSLSPDVIDFMLGAKPDSCSMRIGESGSPEYIVHECPAMQRFPIPDLHVRYTTPKFMAAQSDGEHLLPRKHAPDQYHGALVEYYTADWRRGDEADPETRREWVERSEMVW